MNEEKEREIAQRLMRLPQVGPVRFKELLRRCGGRMSALVGAPQQLWASVPGLSAEVYEAFQEGLKRPLPDPGGAYKDLGAQFVCQEDTLYPDAFKRLDDAPIGCYGVGVWEHLRKPCIAIVGSRRATLYGRKLAKQLAFDLAQAGCCIVSGLALGIDAAAHEGALEAGGATVAVLGCGLDIVYPMENKSLYERIREKGLMLSEFFPGRRADRQTFPRRNRLVSGLSRGLVVIESDLNGGSMITARCAADQGCPVYALPGRVDQASSRGCHALIREGATLITHAQDVLEDLGWGMRPSTQSSQSPQQMQLPAIDLESLPEGPRRLLRSMQPGEAYTLEGLGSLLALSPAHVASSLMLLEIKRAVVKKIDGTFERRF